MYDIPLVFDKLADVRVLHGLVKRWKADLEDDAEEPLQAHFLFKNNLVGSVNQISCNLYISVNKIIDGFSPCQVLYMTTTLSTFQNIPLFTIHIEEPLYCNLASKMKLLI